MDNQKMLEAMAYLWSHSPQLNACEKIVATQLEAFQTEQQTATREELDSELLSLFVNFVSDFLTEIGQCIADNLNIVVSASMDVDGSTTTFSILLGLDDSSQAIAYEYTLG